jgi:putative flippase GtrA
MLPRFGRFAVVGIGGLVVNNVVLLLLHGLWRMALLPATVVAVEIAIVHNYTLNEVWTFRRRRLSVQRFAGFSLAAAVSLLINVGVVALLAGIGLFYLLANLAGIGAAFAINFAVSSMWIWSERTNGADRADPTEPDLAAADDPGRTHTLFDDLHLGSARGGRIGAGARRARRAAAVLYRHRSGAARGGGHPGDHRPRRTH